MNDNVGSVFDGAEEEWGAEGVIDDDDGVVAMGYLWVPTTTKDGIVWDTKANNDPSKYGYKTGKHELLPIPFKEVKMNSNIQQNPGWDW